MSEQTRFGISTYPEHEPVDTLHDPEALERAREYVQAAFASRRPNIDQGELPSARRTEVPRDNSLMNAVRNWL